MILVTHYQRRPGVGSYSLERLYEDVRENLPNRIQVNVRVNRYMSRGIIRRLADALLAARMQTNINHVTGDVHYLTYFMNKKRTILTILDCVSLERSNGIKFWLLWFFWYWLPEKRCSAIPVISEATRRQLLDYLGCDPRKIRVIYCNVSNEFQASPKLFQTDCPRILHVGTISNKNLDRHVMALEGIRCTFVIIGRLTTDQKALLKQHGISYENHADLSREQLVDAYERSDMLLFASTYEGFGLPIVEAQAVGRPVVTGNCWSMPEVAGDAACLVNPFDVDSIRAGVQRIIEDAEYREVLVNRGFENVKRFRADVIAAQYADLYREVHEAAR